MIMILLGKADSLNSASSHARHNHRAFLEADLLDGGPRTISLLKCDYQNLILIGLDNEGVARESIGI